MIIDDVITMIIIVIFVMNSVNWWDLKE